MQTYKRENNPKVTFNQEIISLCWKQLLKSTFYKDILSRYESTMHPQHSFFAVAVGGNSERGRCEIQSSARPQIFFETKTCLGSKVILRQRPIHDLDQSIIDVQYQYQESCWTSSSARPPIFMRSISRGLLNSGRYYIDATVNCKCAIAVIARERVPKSTKLSGILI